jgi:hypothetical protein
MAVLRQEQLVHTPNNTLVNCVSCLMKVCMFLMGLLTVCKRNFIRGFCIQLCVCRLRVWQCCLLSKLKT